MLSHFGYLAAILVSTAKDAVAVMVLRLAFVFLGITYRYKSIIAKNENLHDFATLVFVLVGAIATYWLHAHLGWSTVLASATVGLIISFLPNFNKNSELLAAAPTAVYCGSFVGMSHNTDTPNYIFICVANMFTGLLLIGLKDSFLGFGGKLGSVAFAGVVLAFFLTFLISF